MLWIKSDTTRIAGDAITEITADPEGEGAELKIMVNVHTTTTSECRYAVHGFLARQSRHDARTNAGVAADELAAIIGKYRRDEESGMTAFVSARGRPAENGVRPSWWDVEIEVID